MHTQVIPLFGPRGDGLAELDLFAHRPHDDADADADADADRAATGVAWPAGMG